MPDFQTRRSKTRRITTAAVIAAAYAALTLLLPIPQYGSIQFRLAEALTVLPFLIPEAVPGLAVGCFLANLIGSPMVLDWVVGTLATLLAALWTARVKNKWLVPLPPVLCNMAIVGAEVAWFETSGSGAFLPAYGFSALSIGIGEACACYVLGMGLLCWLLKVSALRTQTAQR